MDLELMPKAKEHLQMEIGLMLKVNRLQPLETIHIHQDSKHMH